MTRVEYILGHESDAHWQDEAEGNVEGLRVDRLELTPWDARKRSVHKMSNQGEEVVLALTEGSSLRDGDILACDSTRLLVCRMVLCEVMVLRINGHATVDVASNNADSLMKTCVHLGHVLGSQHWPAVVSRGCVYVPLSVERGKVDAIMDAHGLMGVSYVFRPGADVLDELTEAQAQCLFGEGGQTEQADQAPSEGQHQHKHSAHAKQEHHHHNKGHGQPRHPYAR